MSRNGGPKAKAPKAKTAEQIATAYYHAGSSGSALAARGDFLTEHGMIEHRVAALGSRKYTIDGVAAQGKGGARLDVSFKGVRNQMHESVQWLSRDEMREDNMALKSEMEQFQRSLNEGIRIGNTASPGGEAAPPEKGGDNMGIDDVRAAFSPTSN